MVNLVARGSKESFENRLFEFWQHIYISVARSGCHADHAKWLADEGVKALMERTKKLEME